ncbi:MAG: phage tail protein I [Sphingomonadaceae bacterium]|nr:phage tail protein I [Sphingomonadaceae bacterium]
MMASLLPPNATQTELSLEAAAARVGDVPVPIRSLWNPATCPVAFLPWLAWALSVDTWNPDWAEATKRARIATAIDVQRHKGTLKAIRAVVAVFGGAVSIREWWQQSPAGVPHTFDVVLDVGYVGGQPPSAQLIDDVVTAIDRAKPARSHFGFALAIDAVVREGLIAVARPVVLARLEATA